MPSYTSAKQRPTYPFDANLQFKDAGLVAASAAATVASAAAPVNVGTGFFSGDMVIDVTAIEVATGDEVYTITVQGGTESGFSSGTEVELQSIKLGDSSVQLGDTDDVVGRYVLPFTNRAVDGTCYQYLRVYTTVAGTVATGINYTAYACPHQS